MKNLTLLITLFLFSFFGCVEEEPLCPEHIALGTFSVLEGSKAYFPYEAESKVIFINEIGEELALEVENISDFILNGQLLEYCDPNPRIERKTTYFYTALGKAASLVNTDGSFLIRINLSTSPGKSNLIKEEFADIIHVQANHSNGNSESEYLSLMQFTANQRTNPIDDYPVQRIGTIELAGKSFSDVLKSETIHAGQNYTSYYHKQLGLIAFTDVSGIFWRFDRVE